MLKEHLQPLGLISARLPLLHKCYYFHFSSPFVKCMENSNQSRAHFTSRRPWLVDFIFSLYCQGLTGSVLYVVCIKDSNWLCLIRHCSSSSASYACGQLFPLICTSRVRVYYNLLSHFPFVPWRIFKKTLAFEKWWYILLESWSWYKINNLRFCVIVIIVVVVGVKSVYTCSGCLEAI